MGPAAAADTHYQNALTEIHRELRRPTAQRKLFALAQTSPTDLVRSKLSTAEIQSRALSSLPDDLLANIPADNSSYSLFQGFQATLPEPEYDEKSHRRRNAKHQKLLDGNAPNKALPSSKSGLQTERSRLNRRLDMMGVRKNMCSAEIHEIDSKIANLNNMRKIVLDRLAGLELDEGELETKSRAARFLTLYTGLTVTSRRIGYENRRHGRRRGGNGHSTGYAKIRIGWAFRGPSS